MAKSLGQIHTTKFNYEGTNLDITDNRAFLCDNSAKLSKQFNRNIRMMQSYKWVGADLVVQLPESMNPFGDESTEVSVKGRMRYFAPTKGRCNALRNAYHQVRESMKSQGVTPSDNRLYDFRVIPRQLTNYPMNASAYGAGNEIYQTATLNGAQELSMIDGHTDGTEVFTAYNSGVAPEDTFVSGADFATGLQTQVGTLVTQTDFVLNEGDIQSGNPLIADVQMEEIPFVLTFNGVDKRTTSLQWRPDPALYVSVLGGFVEIVLDEIKASGATGGSPIEGFEMDVSLHWAGWKSIVQPPKINFGRSSRSSKRMRSAASKLTQKNIKDVLSLLAMAKKLK